MLIDRLPVWSSFGGTVAVMFGVIGVVCWWIRRLDRQAWNELKRK